MAVFQRIIIGVFGTAHITIGVMLAAQTTSNLLQALGFFVIACGCFLFFVTLFGSKKMLNWVIEIVLSTISK